MRQGRIKEWVFYAAGIAMWGSTLAQASLAPLQTETGFYLQDHLGSTRVMTDALGVEQIRYAYYPYGELLIPPNPPLKKGGMGGFSPYLYTGQLHDPESNFYYYSARYYDPKIGRFLSIDPDPQGFLAHYSYVKNNPLVYVDPNGQWEVWFHYALTVEITKSLGYSDSDVAEIGYFSARVDKMWTGPSKNFSSLAFIGVPSLHFKSAWSSLFFMNRMKISLLPPNHRLGALLHQAQDYITHANFWLPSPVESLFQLIHHFGLGEQFYPDDPTRKSEEALGAADATVAQLLDKNPRYRGLSIEEKIELRNKIVKEVVPKILNDTDTYRSAFAQVKKEIMDPDISVEKQRELYENYQQQLEPDLEQQPSCTHCILQ
jgi:RHS repeat-associated protein